MSNIILPSEVYNSSYGQLICILASKKDVLGIQFSVNVCPKNLTKLSLMLINYIKSLSHIYWSPMALRLISFPWSKEVDSCQSWDRFM